MAIRTTVKLGGGAATDEGLYLSVVGAQRFATIALPKEGALLIGRADNAHVQLSDALASRNHARLHVKGGTFWLEDLKSANGTLVRGEPLVAGQRAPLALGDAVIIGTTVLMVQRGRQRALELLPHGYFEARLEEACGAATGDEELALVRVDIDDEVSASRIVQILSGLLRPEHVLGASGPRSYEILVPKTPAAAARRMASALPDRLKEVGLRARVGLALFPKDGRTARALLIRAASDVRRGVGDDGARPMVLEAEAMQRLYEEARAAAAGTINVLILGETGSGKEVLAESLHRFSPRAGKPFVCVDCAALPENLLESELFGHEKGAFTGADRAKPGLLEAAPGGTIFLDEIGELPLPTQAKLLRALETKKLTRVGGVEPRGIDVRFLAATNRDLAKESEAGRFRKDLYFRLAGVTLRLPPLRERVSEIAPLARLFIGEVAAQLGRAEPALSPEALSALEAHAWPGNIRELRNVIERAVLLCRGGEIRRENLPPDLGRSARTMATAPADARTMPPPAAGPRPAAGEAVRQPAVMASRGAAVFGTEDDRQRVIDALNATAGNQSRAAELLGISRSSLVARLNAYDIPRPRRK
jgi:DNA-binding NtrC family response regulator